MISADQLTKVYENDVMGLDHLTLEVKPGEIFCMLGANGAGKTTTINVFLNFIEPTSGKVLINGIDGVVHRFCGFLCFSGKSCPEGSG